jgi:hypothetical protein
VGQRLTGWEQGPRTARDTFVEQVAVARVTLVPPQVLLRRLERRLPVLRGGARPPAAPADSAQRACLALGAAGPARANAGCPAGRLCRWLHPGRGGGGVHADCRRGGGCPGVEASPVDQSRPRREEQAEGELRFWRLEMMHE